MYRDTATIIHTWYSTKLLMCRGGMVTQLAKGDTSRQHRRKASTREAIGGSTLGLRQPDWREGGRES